MTEAIYHSDTLAETHASVRPPQPLIGPDGFWRRRLVAALTGLAVMITGATPVHADKNDDLAKALAAIAIVGIIAAEANKDKGRGQTRDKPGHGNTRRVPEVCAIDINSGRTEVTVYAERCMREEGFSYRLPEHCAGSIRIYGQRDRIYSAQCLRDAGFRVGRGRGN